MFAGLPQRGQVWEVCWGGTVRKRTLASTHLYVSSRQISPRMVVFLRYCRHRPCTPLPRPVLLRVVRLSMAHQRAAVNPSEQEDHIARQVGQGAVAGVVLAPAPALLVEQRLDAARRPGALGVFLREGVRFLLAPAHFVLELIDLAAGTRLAAIEATGVEEEGPAHLLALPLHLVGGHRRGGNQGVHAPINPQDPRDVPPGRQGLSG